MPDRYDITRRAYDAVARGYADNAFAKQWMRQCVSEFCSRVQPNATILDLGCGPGNDASLFVQHKMQVVGVDFSEEMILEARRRVPSATFICRDLRDVSFDDGMFDGVWSVGSLHHVAKSDMPDVLGKIHRLLKPDGRMFIAIKSGEGERLLAQKQVGVGVVTKKFWSCWKLNDIEMLLAASGFTIERIQLVESMRKLELEGKRRHEMWIHAWLST